MVKFFIETCGYAHECTGRTARERWDDFQETKDRVTDAVISCTNSHEWENLLCAHRDFYTGIFREPFSLNTIGLWHRQNIFNDLSELNRLLDTARQREQWRPDISRDELFMLENFGIWILENLGISENQILYLLFRKIMRELQLVSLWISRTEKEIHDFESQIWSAQSIIGVYIWQIVGDHVQA